jgi:hypothetical protein
MGEVVALAARLARVGFVVEDGSPPPTRTDLRFHGIRRCRKQWCVFVHCLSFPSRPFRRCVAVFFLKKKVLNAFLRLSLSALLFASRSNSVMPCVLRQLSPMAKEGDDNEEAASDEFIFFYPSTTNVHRNVETPIFSSGR